MAQDSVELRRVSIDLFQAKRQVMKAVAEIIEEANADRTEPLLIIVMNTASRELSRFKTGHLFDTWNRPIEFNIDGLNTGTIRYLFLAVGLLPLLTGRLASTNFRLIVYQKAVMEVLGRIEDTPVHVFATRSEFRQLKTTAGQYWRPAFNPPQHPAFEEALENYARHRFVLMSTINKNRQINFHFPHMQHPDQEIYEFVRNKFEQAPCEHCGAIKIKGGFNSCCTGYESTIANHLPHPMPDGIIGCIENETAQTNLNYPRRLNRDLRPVIQNADIRAPRAAGSAIFITGVPYAILTRHRRSADKVYFKHRQRQHKSKVHSKSSNYNYR
jgi:hypothetical protein